MQGQRRETPATRLSRPPAQMRCGDAPRAETPRNEHTGGYTGGARAHGSWGEQPGNLRFPRGAEPARAAGSPPGAPPLLHPAGPVPTDGAGRDHRSRARTRASAPRARGRRAGARTTRPAGPDPHPPAGAAPPALAAVVALAEVQRHRGELPPRRRGRRRVHGRGGSGWRDTAHRRRQEAGRWARPEAPCSGPPRAAIAAPATPRPSRPPPMRLCRAPVSPVRVRPPAPLRRVCLRSTAPARWLRPAPTRRAPARACARLPGPGKVLGCGVRGTPTWDHPRQWVPAGPLRTESPRPRLRTAAERRGVGPGRGERTHGGAELPSIGPPRWISGAGRVTALVGAPALSQGRGGSAPRSARSSLGRRSPRSRRCTAGCPEVSPLCAPPCQHLAALSRPQKAPAALLSPVPSRAPSLRCPQVSP